MFKMKTHAVELIASVVQPLAFDLVVLVGVAIELADIVCSNFTRKSMTIVIELLIAQTQKHTAHLLFDSSTADGSIWCVPHRYYSTPFYHFTNIYSPP
jgi:hypothetical protein